MLARIAAALRPENRAAARRRRLRRKVLWATLYRRAAKWLLRKHLVAKRLIQDRIDFAPGGVGAQAAARRVSYSCCAGCVYSAAPRVPRCACHTRRLLALQRVSSVGFAVPVILS